MGTIIRGHPDRLQGLPDFRFGSLADMLAA